MDGAKLDICFLLLWHLYARDFRWTKFHAKPTEVSASSRRPSVFMEERLFLVGTQKITGCQNVINEKLVGKFFIHNEKLW